MRKQNPKFVYCNLLRHGLEYPAFIEEAKRIACELRKLKDDGFLDKEDGVDAFRMAGILEMFGATVEEIHVPVTQERLADKWSEIRNMLK